jgi:hypothetical protein
MNHDEVRELEDACERALSEVLQRRLPPPWSPRLSHLMAKAAVAVLEAVVDDRDEDE